MNWEAIGAIGEIIGAIAVVATLAYLAHQIRQNSNAIKGSTISAITQHQQFELHWSSEISSAMRKIVDGSGDLTEDELWQASEFFTASLTTRQNEYFQYKNGLLLEESWDASKKVIRVIFGIEWVEEWYNTYGKEVLTDVFNEEIEKIVQEQKFDFVSTYEEIRKIGVNDT